MGQDAVLPGTKQAPHKRIVDWGQMMASEKNPIEKSE